MKRPILKIIRIMHEQIEVFLKNLLKDDSSVFSILCLQEDKLIVIDILIDTWI